MVSSVEGICGEYVALGESVLLDGSPPNDQVELNIFNNKEDGMVSLALQEDFLADSRRVVAPVVKLDDSNDFVSRSVIRDVFRRPDELIVEIVALQVRPADIISRALGVEMHECTMSSTRMTTIGRWMKYQQLSRPIL